MIITDLVSQLLPALSEADEIWIAVGLPEVRHTDFHKEREKKAFKTAVQIPAHEQSP